eukprot:CAMPEP_0202691818 /NCGR_PEP_ID=MMETSP1385-20130828/6418_1 /ASSEMBLY_ACC=CAM_ASM_000861 /TAXON_ID=933848 /ORGANISM="Elphidium margaritaceum" /LENGTH=176 /DNA_ID=CAMNT_0049347271 /DNA_START=92 /DNA_END=622 /DNA_ORIENTATION=-
MSRLLFVIATIASVFGEMCLLSPYQRGGLVPDHELDMGGPECNIRNVYPNGTDSGSPPCYSRSNDDERISGFIGTSAEQIMVVTKNGREQWYNAARPGNFSFELYEFHGNDKLTFIKELGNIRDTNNTRGLYQMNSTIPKVQAEEHYVVRAVYYTNSKDEAGNEVQFIQCADVLAI